MCKKQRAELTKRRKGNINMSRLGEALVARNEARVRYEEAKHDLLEAVVETIERSENGLLARELANEANVPIRLVMGVLQSASRRRVIRGRRERTSVEYVRLNPDGSVNLNDRIVRIYRANRYTVCE